MRKVKVVGDLNTNENPSWPPKKHEYILVQKTPPNGDIYIGKIIHILQKNTGVIISLINGFENPYDEAKNYIKSTVNSRNYMVVNESHGWRYTTKDKLDLLNKYKLLRSSQLAQSTDPIKNEERLYDDIRPPGITLTSSEQACTTNNLSLSKLISSQDLDDFAFLLRCDKKEIEDLRINETFNADTIKNNISDKLKSYRNQIIDLLEGRITKCDHEEESDTEESDTRKANMDMTKPQEIEINESFVMNCIEDPKKLTDYANKLKKTLREKFCLEGESEERNPEKLYGTLRFIYYNEYIHVFRTEIPLREDITHELLGDTKDEPKLKILGENEYGIPIRHNVLKYILFQNELQKAITVDKELLEEAELILSQEYIIALTPEPRYQIWCLVRLIKLWYGDIDLQNNIRKIKVIVNQYRVRSDVKFNIKNGIRFSIGVYPRYGKKSASIVLKKLIYYFAIYSQAIGWKHNPPSYFKVVNDLISYTNCDQSLKLYYRRIAEKNKQTNDVFSENYTFIKSKDYNTDILEQYTSI